MNLWHYQKAIVFFITIAIVEVRKIEITFTNNIGELDAKIENEYLKLKGRSHALIAAAIGTKMAMHFHGKTKTEDEIKDEVPGCINEMRNVRGFHRDIIDILQCPRFRERLGKDITHILLNFCSKK